MTKKLKKIRHSVSNKCPKTQKPPIQPEVINNKNTRAKNHKKKKKQPKQKKIVYNQKNFNTLAFPNKPVVDCGIINFIFSLYKYYIIIQKYINNYPVSL